MTIGTPSEGGVHAAGAGDVPPPGEATSDWEELWEESTADPPVVAVALHSGHEAPQPPRTPIDAG